jgi:hypothetical protein
MTHKDSKEHMDSESAPEKRSGETHSGTPNADDPNKTRSTEHKSGYGGEGGEPRTSSDQKETKTDRS